MQLIAFQNNATPTFPTLRQEVPAHAMARDLAGVRTIRERTRPLAHRHPGWVSFLRLANVHVFRLRGEDEKALAEVALMRQQEGGRDQPSPDMFEAIPVEVELRSWHWSERCQPSDSAASS